MIKSYWRTRSIRVFRHSAMPLTIGAVVVAVSAFVVSTAEAQSNRVATTNTASRSACAKGAHANPAQVQGSLPASAIAKLKAQVAEGWTLTSAGRVAIAGGDPRTKAKSGFVLLALGPGSKSSSSPPAGLVHATRTVASARVAQRITDDTWQPLFCLGLADVDWYTPSEYLDWHADSSYWDVCGDDEGDDCYNGTGVDNYCYGQCEYDQWVDVDEEWVLGTDLADSDSGAVPTVVTWICDE